MPDGDVYTPSDGDYGRKHEQCVESVLRKGKSVRTFDVSNGTVSFADCKDNHVASPSLRAGASAANVNGNTSSKNYRMSDFTFYLRTNFCGTV